MVDDPGQYRGAAVEEQGEAALATLAGSISVLYALSLSSSRVPLEPRVLVPTAPFQFHPSRERFPCHI